MRIEYGVPPGPLGLRPATSGSSGGRLCKTNPILGAGRRDAGVSCTNKANLGRSLKWQACETKPINHRAGYPTIPLFQAQSFRVKQSQLGAGARFQGSGVSNRTPETGPRTFVRNKPNFRPDADPEIGVPRDQLCKTNPIAGGAELYLSHLQGGSYVKSTHLSLRAKQSQLPPRCRSGDRRSQGIDCAKQSQFGEVRS